MVYGTSGEDAHASAEQDAKEVHQSAQISVKASAIVWFIPCLCMVSPSTGYELAYRLDPGLKPIDAEDWAKACDGALFRDTPMDVLRQAGLVNLLKLADDWRWMTQAESAAFLERERMGGDPYPDDLGAGLAGNTEARSEDEHDVDL